MKYAARAMMINEMDGLTFNCTQEEVVSGVCSAVTGQQVIDLFRFYDKPEKLIGIMIAVTVGYRLFAWGVLLLRCVGIGGYEWTYLTDRCF